MATDRSVGSALLHSPLPLIAAGIGLTLFLTTRKKPLLTQRDIDAISRKLSRTARKAAKVADRQYRAGREYLADRGEVLLDKASDTLSNVGHRARSYGGDGLSAMKSQLTKDHSMALSALGVGLGALASILGARGSRRIWH
jgi:hypothetical protein